MTQSIQCPLCGSSDVKRARSGNVFERTAKVVGFKAYRCRRCNWRGIVRSGSPAWTIMNSRDITRSVSIVAAVAMALIVALVLARYLG